MQDPHTRALLQERTALRDAAFYQRHGGFIKPVGEHTAGIWSRICFNWVKPLISQGTWGQLEEPTAQAFLPPCDDAAYLSAQFWQVYNAYKVCFGHNCSCYTIVGGVDHRLCCHNGAHHISVACAHHVHHTTCAHHMSIIRGVHRSKVGHGRSIICSQEHCCACTGLCCSCSCCGVSGRCSCGMRYCYFLFCFFIMVLFPILFYDKWYFPLHFP